MNIFAFHHSPRLCALWLDDVRKNKMILESCQLMSTACNVLLPNHNFDVYKNFNKNHPCNKWVRASYKNYYWLYRYTNYLITMRGKNHECIDIWHNLGEMLDPKYFPSYDLTPFANSAANQDVGISFKHIQNPHTAYRMYINERWKIDIHNKYVLKLPNAIDITWNHGQKPNWSKV